MATIQQNRAEAKVSAKELAGAKGTLSLKNLIGNWNNCDKNTRGLVRVVLAAKGSTLTVHGFGACSPTPCDWGVVEGIAYGESVVATEAIAFTAHYDFGFAETIVTGRLDSGTLIVDTFDKFKDGSGRSNYCARVYLCRG